jgi:hypothetical protein
MPLKIQVDENLVFLYRCLVNSDCKSVYLGQLSICIPALLIFYPQIDFNAVGAAMNLKAPAARLRYSRLKKSIETMLGESSRKAPVGSTKTPAIKKIKTSPTVAKKRKVSYDSEDDEYDLVTLDEDIGSVTIKDEELQQWTAGPRTRGKKIDLKDAFDSDSSTGPGLRKESDGSSDDYKIEDVSEDEDELYTNEAYKDEDGQLVSRRRKSGSQSTNRKADTTNSAITASKSLNRPFPRSVPDKSVNETLAKPEVSLMPEPGIYSPSETKAKNVTLPSTPQYMAIGVMKQEPTDLTSTVPKIRPAPPQRSTATRTNKITRAAPQPSLFDRIESARIQADYKLASLSHQANKNSRYQGDNLHTDNEIILPSIEYDEEDDNSAMWNASRNTSSMATTPPILHPRKLSSTGNADESDHGPQTNAPGQPPVLEKTTALLKKPLSRPEPKETCLLPHHLLSVSRRSPPAQPLLKPYLSEDPLLKHQLTRPSHAPCNKAGPGNTAKALSMFASNP